MDNRGRDKQPDRGAAQGGDGREARLSQVPIPLGPGSKVRRGEQPKDTVRAMLFERIRDRGLTIADLSRALQRNEAYMHQFIWRGTPKWLREADRAVVCQMLDIPESLLRPSIPDVGPPLASPPANLDGWGNGAAQCAAITGGRPDRPCRR